MINQIGGFTTYGIEYFYEFLGQERIYNKIDETKDTPTMGTKFVDFVKRLPDFSFSPGTGVFHAFHYVLSQYCNEFDVSLFLFESSKKYSEQNYFNSGLLKNKWAEYLQQTDKLDSNLFSYEYKADAKANPFWTELHFLYQDLLSGFMKFRKVKFNLSTNIEGGYILEKNKLVSISSIILEVKTKRKPLTGQYLLYREGDVYFNLEPLSISGDLKSYKFIKDETSYNLFINEESKSGKIVKEGVKSYSENEKLLLKTNIDELIIQLGDIYINNFNSISERFRLARKVYEGGISLANGIMIDLSDFYLSNGDNVKANRIISLNNSYPDVWNEIGEFEEEEGN